jgi:hypothetical protein
VGGLEWSNDPESYAGGSIATGRASHVGKVKGDVPDKETPWSSRLGVGLTTHTCGKIAIMKTREMSLGGKGKWRRPWQCLIGGPRPWIEMNGGLSLSQPRPFMGCSAWDDDDDDDYHAVHILTS